MEKMRLGLDPRTVHVVFVVDQEALDEVFLPVLLLSPVSIIPPMLHTYLHLHVAVTRRTNARSLGTFQKAMFFGNRGAVHRKNFHLACKEFTAALDRH